MSLDNLKIELEKARGKLRLNEGKVWPSVIFVTINAVIRIV